MISMILKYNTKNFLKSFFSVLVFFLIFSFILELLFIKKNLIVKTTSVQQYEYLFLKVATLINKIFPFIIFISGILWVLKMKRLRTWSIFQSSGVSITQILKGPTLAVILISLFELLYWGPWCHGMMEKAWSIQKKETYWIKPKAGWQFIHTPCGRNDIFYLPDTHMELFSFSKNFILRSYVYANKFSVYPHHLRLQRVWVMETDKPPKFLSFHTLKRPSQLFDHTQRKHPFLMSFLELNFQSPNTFLSRTIVLRRQCFLSNTAWFCLLLPFSSAVLSGYYRSVYYYISSIFFGSVICFVLFLAKEWSCMVSYAMTGHLLSYIIVWSVPLVTALLTLVLWIEKAEL
ncbi:LptF/LptG family permease [Holospora curviuscula]|uniref:Putative permease YjgP/YjgQ family protein n=1 Tax=Holospora curviuscula TaxID=1082868 RepID=A0A2S5RA21_9PROT|nr:LptF/LptG family permease [Holospora curviuscula]PPE04176.1 putative permease YjgP/YjgQ family protein [Holospora curviuscula]